MRQRLLDLFAPHPRLVALAESMRNTRAAQALAAAIEEFAPGTPSGDLAILSMPEAYSEEDRLAAAARMAERIFAADRRRWLTASTRDRVVAQARRAGMDLTRYLVECVYVAALCLAVDDAEQPQRVRLGGRRLTIAPVAQAFGDYADWVQQRARRLAPEGVEGRRAARRSPTKVDVREVPTPADRLDQAEQQRHLRELRRALTRFDAQLMQAAWRLARDQDTVTRADLARALRSTPAAVDKRRERARKKISDLTRPS